MRRLVLILAVFLLLTAGCAGKDSETRTGLPPAVTVEEVLLSEQETTLQTEGMVRPWKNTVLGFQVAGRIVQPPPQTGAAVDTGAVLAQLDSTDYEIQAEAARHQLELARLEYDRSVRELDRCTQLYEAEAISTKDFEDALDQNRAAELRAAQAENSLRQAQRMVGHTCLAAPFAGIVMERLVEQGDMTAPGTPVLVLADTARVKVEISVAASEITAWPVDAKATVTVDGLKTEARVEQVSPGAQANTGTFTVTLALDNPDDRFRPGEIVPVTRRVLGGEGLWIPLNAVVSRGDRFKSVFVYDSAQQTVTERQIQLGTLADDRIQVTEGLNPGDRIVVTVPENLRDRDKVEAR